MKNVEEGENVCARFASFFMAAQPLLHIREANASLKSESIGNHKRISANSNFEFVMHRDFLQMKRAWRRMKNEAAFGHEECGRRGKCAYALCFIFHGGAAAASCSRSERFIERCEVMKNDKLSVQSMDFAVNIIALVKDLKNQRETIISNQIGRSGTSIGANIREAQYAHGKPDFVAKLQIALKEANETGYWLELLQRTGYLPMESYRHLDAQCTSLRAMLVASINTAKKNQE